MTAVEVLAAAHSEDAILRAKGRQVVIAIVTTEEKDAPASTPV